MDSILITDIEEENITQERIVSDNILVPKELFCQICGYLLWKPRSCSSCQNLFCYKCIRTWYNTNSISCPFRCSPYNEKRAPPHIQSILGRLLIRCRNTQFGCKDIVLYDLLEKHEQVDCLFRTKRCNLCEELVLLDRFHEHPSLCKPTYIKCNICQCAVEPTLFQTHTENCSKEILTRLIQANLRVQNEAHAINNIQQTTTTRNPFETWIKQTVELGSRPPTINLPGIQAYYEARQHSWIYRILMMLALVLRNPASALHIFLILGFIGFTSLLIYPFSYFLSSMPKLMKTSTFSTCALVITLNGLFMLGFPLLLQISSDKIIICVSLISILLGATNPFVVLDNFEMHETSTILSIIYVAIWLLSKLAIFIARLFFYCVPPYLTAAWTMIFIGFHIRHLYNPIPEHHPITNNENDLYFDCDQTLETQ